MGPRAGPSLLRCRYLPHSPSSCIISRAHNPETWHSRQLHSEQGRDRNRYFRIHIYSVVSLLSHLSPLLHLAPVLQIGPVHFVLLVGDVEEAGQAAVVDSSVARGPFHGTDLVGASLPTRVDADVVRMKGLASSNTSS